MSEGDLPELPFRFQEEPLIGYKKLCVSLSNGLLVLEGSRGKYEGLSPVAVCLKKGEHTVPSRECECGFYSYNSARPIYYSGDLYATVEVFGTVIVCKEGYRSSRQRIIALAMERECQMCRIFGDSRRMADGLYFGMSGGRPTLLCEEHGELSVRLHAAMKMTLAAASEQLGLEVTWYKG